MSALGRLRSNPRNEALVCEHASSVDSSCCGHDSSINSPVFQAMPSEEFLARRRQPFGNVMSLNSDVGRQLSAPRRNDIPRLLNDLERSICARLDRIDYSLRVLAGPKDPITAVDHGPASGPDGRAASLKQTETDPASLDALDLISGFSASEPAAPRVGRGPGVGEFPQVTRLALRLEWQKEALRPTHEALVSVPSQRQLTSARSLLNLEQNLDDDEEVINKPWYVFLPSSRFRVLWDVVTMMIIAHDMAVVPVALAFEKGHDLFTPWLKLPFLMFWTVDIPLSFLTGFYRNGRIEARLPMIALNFAKTWLLMDLAMVASTWMEMLASKDASVGLLGRVGKSLRILRVMHSIRILRMAKLRRLTEEFRDRVTSEYYHILISVVKLILLILWINHFIACCWWGLGVSVHTSERNSWTEFYDFEDMSLGFQYFTSLHWSLTQFTPASMEVSARNLPERIFSVIVLLFAMVAFSSFVSSITASMTQLRQLYSRYDSNFSMLRRYLQSHHVPLELLVRILHCVHYRVRRQMREIQESQVQFLQFLSKPLQMELSSHIFAPMLTEHPFFRRYSEVDPVALRHICLKAVAQISLSTEDLLFTEGSRCEQMYYLMSGQLIYSMRCKYRLVVEGAVDNEDFVVKDPDDQVLDEKQWCCEISMWCPWVHVGTALAVRMSDVLSVDVSAFCSVTGSFHAVRRYTALYAEAFIERTMAAHCRDPALFSDLSALSSTELEDVIVTAQHKRKLPSSAESPRSASVSKDDQFTI